MRAIALILPLALAACLPQQDPAPDGASDFAYFCADCHGSRGDGKGELAHDLPKAPADLTALRQSHGGAFPGTKVMAKVWGPMAPQDQHAIMPGFAALFESDLVPYDGGDGVYTPTPRRLVAISEYLKTIQR